MPKKSLEEFEELHDKIKQHPYRLNREEKYIKSYAELCYELSDQFWYHTRESKYKNASRMIHDFNLWIANLNRIDKEGNPVTKVRDFADYHVERCISAIHHFIDTGKADYYFDFFNTKVGGEWRSVKIVYNEETEMFEIPPYESIM